MNRIIKFVITNHGELAAGLRPFTDFCEIKLDWYDDDSLPELTDAFRKALQDFYDTTDVQTQDEYDETIRKQDVAFAHLESGEGDD